VHGGCACALQALAHFRHVAKQNPSIEPGEGEARGVVSKEGRGLQTADETGGLTR